MTRFAAEVLAHIVVGTVYAVDRVVGTGILVMDATRAAAAAGAEEWRRRMDIAST